MLERATLHTLGVRQCGTEEFVENSLSDRAAMWNREARLFRRRGIGHRSRQGDRKPVPLGPIVKIHLDRPVLVGVAGALVFAVERLDQIVLNCNDVEATASRYERVLGIMRETFGSPEVMPASTATTIVDGVTGALCTDTTTPPGCAGRTGARQRSGPQKGQLTIPS